MTGFSRSVFGTSFSWWKVGRSLSFPLVSAGLSEPGAEERSQGSLLIPYQLKLVANARRLKPTIGTPRRHSAAFGTPVRRGAEVVAALLAEAAPATRPPAEWGDERHGAEGH